MKKKRSAKDGAFLWGFLGPFLGWLFFSQFFFFLGFYPPGFWGIKPLFTPSGGRCVPPSPPHPNARSAPGVCWRGEREKAPHFAKPRFFPAGLGGFLFYTGARPVFPVRENGPGGAKPIKGELGSILWAPQGFPL
eukprot:FR736371.1.p2 GENE.FR736371.1~~FR736371.1.p2  ORF type:complete len:135 (-),score=41.12 FR736371.1:889-1293(-)